MTFESFCKTCNFYLAKPEVGSVASAARYSHTGECHKNAPYGQGTLFPAVDEQDWCGDHQDNTIPTEMVTMEAEDPNAHDLTRCGTIAKYPQWV